MTLSISQMTEALQAPTMEAVIALTERTQTLECHPTGMIYTFYRCIDHSLLIGYTENLDSMTNDLLGRDFYLIASRRGTRREDKLTRITLTENNVLCTYGDQYFDASHNTIGLLNQLNWPVGNLTKLLWLDHSESDNNDPTISIELSQSDSSFIEEF